MNLTMNAVSFDSNEPIKLICSLDNFISVCKNDRVPEGLAVMIARYYLDRMAKMQHNGAIVDQGNGFVTWPGAVLFLLQSYLTETVVHGTFYRLRSTMMQPTETISDFRRGSKIY